MKSKASYPLTPNECFMKESEFPHNNWYIEVTDKNRHIINPWKIKQKYNLDLFENLDRKYVDWEGSGSGRSERISTEDFIKYVLTEEPVKTKSEDMSYLVSLLNKLNIK
jgi:hypothetical protein